MDIRHLVLKKFPKRFSIHSKNNFLKELDQIFMEEGYTSKTIDKMSFRGKVKDQIYSFGKSAKLYIAVPYDTPSRIFWYQSQYFPLDGNRSMNKNMVATYVPAFLFYGIILLFILFVSPNIQNLQLQVILNLAIFAGTISLLWMLFHGFGNRHNTNRNSSSIIAAVEFMQSLQADQKRKIGFVFVDRCDHNCPGAQLLAEHFLKQNKNPDVIWLDCIAKGDVFGIGYRTHGKRLASLLHSGNKKDTIRLFDMNGNKCIQTVMNYFEKGILITSGEMDAKGSLVVKNTQTSKDKELDESNIQFIIELLNKAIPRK